MTRPAAARCVVTLEPCNHTGRTGPCAERLVDAGVAGSWYAVADPTARARRGTATPARGGRRGRDRGARRRGRARQRALADRVRLRRPCVVWKVAATLDGRVAARRRHQPMDLQRPSRGPTPMRCAPSCDVDRRGVGHGAGRRPRAHRARRRRRRWCPTSRCGSWSTPTAVRRSAHGCGTRPAETWVATADEVGADASGCVDLAALLHELHRRGHVGGAARGRADAGGVVRARRPGRRVRGLPGADAAGRRRSRRWRAPASARSPTRVRARHHRRDAGRPGRADRGPAGRAARQRRRWCDVFTGIVEELGEVAELVDLGDSVGWGCAVPIVTSTARGTATRSRSTGCA